MRSTVRRTVALAMTLGAGALILTSPNFACESFAGQSLMTSADFCFIFDCNNGILGGTVQPCNTGLDVNGDLTNPLFIDCPTEE